LEDIVKHLHKNKLLAETLKILQEAGYLPVVEHGNKHIKVRWTSRSGHSRGTTVARGSSQDPRTIKNHRAALRRMIRERDDVPMASGDVARAAGDNVGHSR
jgi:hypothetical protein